MPPPQLLPPLPPQYGTLPRPFEASQTPPGPQVYGQLPPPPPPAPGFCPRCHAPLYPGYPLCANCGYDLRAGWGMPAPLPPKRRPSLPIALAIAGAVLLAVAGAFIVLGQHAGSGSGPTPPPSAIAAASPTPSSARTAGASSSPLATASLSGPAPDTAWITFAPPGDGFSAKFPAKPTLTTQTVRTPSGNAPISLWVYEENSHLDFVAGFGAYPKGSTSGLDLGVVYDGAIAGMESSTGLTVASQRDCTLDGHTGRAFTLSGSQGSVQGQIYLVGDDLFMVYSVYDATIADLSEVNAFIADFQLTV